MRLPIIAAAFLLAASPALAQTARQAPTPTAEGLSATVNDLTQALAGANIRAAKLATEVQHLESELAAQKKADAPHDAKPMPRTPAPAAAK